MSGSTVYSQNNTILYTYDTASERLEPVVIDGREVLLFDIEYISANLKKAASSEIPVAEFFESDLGTGKMYRVGLVSAEPKKSISVVLSKIGESAENEDMDELTGLYVRRSFCKRVDEVIKSTDDFSVVYFDIIKFKAVNDIFGMSEGDRVLRKIGEILCNFLGENGFAARMGSDRFVAFMHLSYRKPETMTEHLLNELAEFDLPFEIALNAGIYVSIGEDKRLSANAMIDRAILAQSVIKGSYTVKYRVYTESLRNEMLGEQEIVGMMANAISKKQFIVHYQPQYSHSTGMLIGTEALVRWCHPERGLISPGLFIPIFEKNGFITRLDMYVFEEVCAFLRRCLDRNLPVVPISTNFSRYDIFTPDFVERLEEMRLKYDLPARLLRVELTESVTIGGIHHVNAVIDKLHQHGYMVEMDDFGSGYSSLNALKDIDMDVIKLDMQFLDRDSDNNKGGTILSSVVRMAKWLNMPVIAEGVETVPQADFLRSIGCDYIQGYLYSRPIPEDKYVELINGSTIGVAVPQMKLIETLNACDFWNPESQETLIFSNYVGAAAILDYHDGEIEVLRVNQKYLRELSMNLSEKEIIKDNPLLGFDDANMKVYLDMLNRAAESGEEEECEVWRRIFSPCCGEEVFCIRSTVRMIGKSGDSVLFHEMIRNITAEKKNYSFLLDSERRFKMASEQVNIYYWEYTIATKEMRPCFRCMRDLGLPPLIINYPDPVIESGIFQPESADLYRDWHKQVAEGVSELEAVMILTPAKVPFKVRYTTEFDENGRPVKAYGSAAPILS